MGSFDGSEVCEIVRLFLLSKLDPMFGHGNVGLYRDDGLGVVSGPGPQIEKKKKDVQDLFKALNFKITIKTNVSEIKFLDIWFNFKKFYISFFEKNNSIPLYSTFQIIWTSFRQFSIMNNIKKTKFWSM